MGNRVRLRVIAPAGLIAVLLSGACLLGVRAVDRLHANLTSVLTDDAARADAANELVVALRQLRFHSFVHAIEPAPDRAARVAADHRAFELALARGRAVAAADPDRRLLDRIAEGYEKYRADLDRPGSRPDPGDPGALLRWADAHPVAPLIGPCEELLARGRAGMADAARESDDVRRRTRFAMLALGVGGPLAGLAGGLAVARSLGRAFAAMQADVLRAEQLAAVGRLAAGVAHEVRNPLTAIKLLTGMALRDGAGLTPDDLRVIHGEVTRLERVAQGLLDFAKLPAADLRPCDVRAVVADAVALVRVRAENQAVRVQVAAPAEPVAAVADTGQLASAVGNLLLNALDAMPAGGILDIEVTAPPGEVRLAVRDTGAGIDAAVADRLFTPFVTTKPTGTGLGLSVSRRVAEGHGGRLSGSNRLTGGAEFVLAIPTHPKEVGRADTAGDR